jgi:ATPase subunit of ABC transporter with duplicated ATPase domains
VGKSTLLRILAGLFAPDRGTVHRTPPDATVGFLVQEPERRAGERVQDLLGRRTGVTAAQHELDAATGALASGEVGADDRYSHALDTWLALGAADFDSRVGEVWAELGLEPALLDRDTTVLSGGEAARASLAVLLLSRFDLFLLDEPTNDLDLDGLARLEAFVTSSPSGMVIVSHDRAFLENVVTHVVELDEHSHRSSTYAGGWAAFQEERATARRHAEEAYEEYVDRKGGLSERARREREWATQGVAKAKKNPKDNDKAQRKFFAERTEQLAARARRTERAIERLDEVDKPWEGWELRLTIPEAERSGAVVARLEGAVVDRGGFRLGPVDLEIGWAERVAIVGANGAGKTTLLSALLGRVPLTGGAQWMGPGVVVGEIDQARALLAGSGSLLDAFLAATGQTVSEARQLLATFGLGADHVVRAAASLSPGERTRAVLALLVASGVNCLVLDEPTNHLDLTAIEQLEQALDSFAGTVLLVTHDRRLLANTRVDRTVRLEAGVITEDRHDGPS